MRQELEARLRGPVNFPSPPAIAQKIIELAQDPDADVSRIADAIGKDPGLTAKILRTANSPLYAQRRKSQNLRQAVLVLGLNATTTLALSFSIVASFKSGTSKGLDYPAFWRRTLLAAIGSRALGDALKLPRAEDLFLAGLLQDLGMLALDRARPGFYMDLPAGSTCLQTLAYERERAGEDHSAIGAWMLKSWSLPEPLYKAVELSHRPEQAGSGSENGRFTRCVAFAGELAEVLVSQRCADASTSLASRALKLLDLRREHFGEVIGQMMRVLPETEQLFQMNILNAQDAAALMDQAREILEERSLRSLSEIESLRETTNSLTARTEELEDANRHDSLTKLYNRAYLDHRLTGEFTNANKNSWPLSVAFVDLDHFKRINDTHGHQAGDQVLHDTAQTLAKSLRDSDVIARYGGEEFVILLPGTDHQSAMSVCERILLSLRQTPHQLKDHAVTVTASIGVATHSAQLPFESAGQLIHAADEAVYAAKHGGRDRIEFTTPQEQRKPDSAMAS